MARYFIADMHLSPERPETTAAFRRQLSALKDVEALYVLGDVFDAYLGDDVMSAFQNEIAHFLRILPYRVVIQHGNRDFLMGKRFADRANIRFLAEHHLLFLNGQKILLAHGDQFCQQDLNYQRFRRLARHPRSQQIYAALPRFLKQNLARFLRRQSHGKAANITDVDGIFIDDLAQRHGIKIIIHGHTHRPAEHQHAWGKRFVLPDWNPSAAFLRYENGVFSWVNASINQHQGETS